MWKTNTQGRVAEWRRRRRKRKRRDRRGYVNGVENERKWRNVIKVMAWD